MDEPTLTLRFDATPEYVTVSVLVDGRDLAEGLPFDYIGFEPRDILGDDSPLLPADPPRRVAVYRCGCGEPGCGCIAPIISRDGSHVVWSDARDYTGVYVAPVHAPNPPGGVPVGIPDLRFDAAQYEAEVRRAAADRSWETG